MVWRDLNRPERLAAWEEIKREQIPEFGMSGERKKVEGRELIFLRVDPRGTKLWLATGRDPNGHDCAHRGRPPTAFSLAILRPLGFCKPYSSASMPFVEVTFHGFSPEAREAAKLMIDAGVSVNEVSPDGVVPLQAAVLRRNEEMVKLLLEAGADPFARAKSDQIGDLRSALEAAESLTSDPSADRIRKMVRDAAERRRLTEPR